jgi:hypothetical protein
MQISRAHFCSCLDNQVFERLGRYEVTLWRQTAQILLLLSVIEFRAKGRLPDERPCFGRCGESMNGIRRLISIPF